MKKLIALTCSCLLALALLLTPLGNLCGRGEILVTPNYEEPIYATPLDK